MLSQRTKVISTWVACDALDHFDATRDELVTAIRELAEERSGLRAENERLREIVDLLMNCGEPEPLMLPGVKICHTWRWTHEVDGRTWTRPAEGENQGVHPRVEELLKEVDRAALASPAPSDSDPDVDAATGCADDQSGLGAAVALLGRDRVDQIMSGADSAPGTDWRKLAMDVVASYDRRWSQNWLDLVHEKLAAIRDAVRREREKEGKAS